jgi:hypothetical protein
MFSAPMSTTTLIPYVLLYTCSFFSEPTPLCLFSLILIFVVSHGAFWIGAAMIAVFDNLWRAWSFSGFMCDHGRQHEHNQTKTNPNCPALDLRPTLIPTFQLYPGGSIH